MDNRLSHLSTDDVGMLITRYYAGESAKKLILEFSLDIKVADLYKTFPPEICEDHNCEYCGTTLVIDRCSRTYAKMLRHNRDMYCPNCLHHPFKSQCKCVNCLNIAQQTKENRLRLIREVYDVPHESVPFEDLSFDSKVYLGALCRALLSEDMLEITPYTTSNVTLAPTKGFSLEILKQLSDKNAIVISPASSIDSFDIEADNFPNSYYPDLVTYILNLSFSSNEKDLLSEILNPTYFSSDLETEALVLWKRIAIYECIEYLLYQFGRVHFKFNPGAKTKEVFETLLNDYSVSQIYGIIYREVSNASRYYLESNISRKHAATSVISMCEKYGEIARIKGWTPTQYYRIKDLPQSALSLFFFNRVLGIGDNGFTNVPSLENLGTKVNKA